MTLEEFTANLEEDLKPIFDTCMNSYAIKLKDFCKSNQERPEKCKRCPFCRSVNNECCFIDSNGEAVMVKLDHPNYRCKIGYPYLRWHDLEAQNEE